MPSKSTDSISERNPPSADRSKGLGLLFGILLVLTLCGLAESIKMIITHSRAALIELIIFALLVADAVVLLLAVTEENRGQPGLLRYMGAWILGLIPYVGWMVVYWAGRRILDILRRHRGIAPAIALLLFIGIAALCVYTFLIVGDSSRTGLPQ